MLPRWLNRGDTTTEAAVDTGYLYRAGGVRFGGGWHPRLVGRCLAVVRHVMNHEPDSQRVHEEARKTLEVLESVAPSEKPNPDWECPVHFTR
ncbi:hypothetical protein DOTSEDRAFT_68975 [Dothistroma septosporum NZE10]|uniref:Uncharacterized protein n=1 Tax=Dothistroma septosporum (strain NZE10 / CBS 128990) TaxID=675120 RepID=N1Q5G1_DOTSN|nr:hypothetical protein DOTSEDRAFT_68975 [Dothistroma septosporum NZE10]